MLNSFNSELQLKDIESAIKNKLKKIQTGLQTLVLVLKKIKSEHKTKYETIINESDIDDNVFKSIYTTVITNIQKIFGKGSGWIIDSVIQHNINI